MAEHDIFHAEADDNFIEFFTKDIYLENKSQQEGRPIYITQDWMRIGSPGDLKTQPEFCIDAKDPDNQYFKRYRKEYEEWKRRRDLGETGIIGTAIVSWTQMPREIALGFKAQGVHTVEMLAAIKDADMPKFGPGTRGWRSQAQNFIEVAKGNAPVARLTKENEDLRNQLAALQQQMTEVCALVKEKGGDPDSIGATSAPAAMTPEAIAALVAQSVAAALAKPGNKPRGRPRGKPFQEKGAAQAESAPAA